MKEDFKKRGVLFFSSGCLVLVNFFTTVIIARSLGFGPDLDLYYLALSVYFFLLAAVGWSLTNVITPILIAEGIERSLPKVFYVLIVWSVILFFLLFLLSPILIDIVFSNYIEDYSLSKIKFIFVLSCLVFVFDLLAQVFICYENASERFVRAVVINLFSSLVGMLAASYLVESFGNIGALLVQLIMKFVLLFVLISLNLKSLTTFEYDKKMAIQLFSRAKYFFVSGLYYRTEDLIEKYIASYLAPGSLSLFSFVQRIYGAVITVINTVLITPSLTRFCNDVKQGVVEYGYMRNIVISIFFLFFISFPVVFFFGRDAFVLVFSDKVSGLDDKIEITLLLLFPIFSFQVINQLLHNFLLSRAKEKKIAVFDVLSYTVSLIFKVILTVEYDFLGFLVGVVFASLIKLLFKTYIVVGVMKDER